MTFRLVRDRFRLALHLAAFAALAVPLACVRDLYEPWLGKPLGDSSLTGGALFAAGNPFTEKLVQARTFTNGTSVATVTYAVADMQRTALGVDFNRDGRIDPVVGYGFDQAVIQILLSRGGSTTEFTSLTLDSKRDMQDLADVAVGDIDRDGNLDVVAAAEGAVWYFHHPADGNTSDLRAWGNSDGTSQLRERIDASFNLLSNEELQALIAQAVGPGVNLDDYVVSVQQLYTNVEAGDFDNDGDNDIAASRSFMIALNPKPETPVEPISIVDGDVMIFVNPGFAIDGVGWSTVSVGSHERQIRLDRDGAAGLLAADIDGDGDLDLVSAAREDNNAQVAWFENPGRPLATDNRWTQWRVGSVRDAWSIDLADLTGDGRLDVVAAGGAQMQVLLFEQPAEGPKRTYDWDSYVLVTLENYEPRDVKAIDIDNNGTLELVLAGTGGAVRYLEPAAEPRAAWTPQIVVTFDPPGDVGFLGYGDLDGDGDLDLVAVAAGEDENDSQIVWIRNDLRAAATD